MHSVRRINLSMSLGHTLGTGGGDAVHSQSWGLSSHSHFWGLCLQHLQQELKVSKWCWGFIIVIQCYPRFCTFMQHDLFHIWWFHFPNHPLLDGIFHYKPTIFWDFPLKTRDFPWFSIINQQFLDTQPFMEPPGYMKQTCRTSATAYSI